MNWQIRRMCSELNERHSMTSPLCLFGAGGHGRVLAAQIASRFDTHIVFGDTAGAVGDRIKGVEVKFSSVEQVLGHSLLITIGDNVTRRRLQMAAQQAGLTLTRAVIDEACYFSTPPGAGSQVLAGAVVNPNALIGAGVIVNSSAVVEHDTHIGDFSHLAPGSVVGGGASVGEGVLLGTNATLLPGISVASGCTIGAGAVVCHDINQVGVYAGVPARRIKPSEGA